MDRVIDKSYPSPSSLIRSYLAQKGMISVAEYMQLCLTHPQLGYYHCRNSLGQNGDFITAPEISQMFGEFIGAWCVHVWTMLDRPLAFNLIELGPGKGTLMADICRTTMKQHDFTKACNIHLVETSPVLRTWQKQMIQKDSIGSISWHNDLESIPSGPLIVIANEFFDALPIHQYISTIGGWRERCIVADTDELIWTSGNIDHMDKIPCALQKSAIGSIFETSPTRETTAAQIFMQMKKYSGAALVIDYGFYGPCLGDTFQAVSKHRFADPLSRPGECDLTSHVDFKSMDNMAQLAEIHSYGPMSQGKFLSELGINIRAGQLCRIQPDKAKDIQQDLMRLIAPEQMGTIFQVMAFTSAQLTPPPPFSCINRADNNIHK